MREWRFGAAVDDDGASFRVWAPAQPTLHVVLDNGGEHPLQRSDDGFHAARIDGLRPGQRYWLQLATGRRPGWIGPRGLRDFDLVLSYTGGAALEELRGRLGAGAVAALYGSVDPEVHRPVAADPELRADLSYLGTYAADRQAALEMLFIEPARQRPAQRFLIGGAKYPPEFPWAENIFFTRHVAPSRHAAFFSSSRLTLNITRAAMKRMGYCPSGRLFEAAACGAPLLSDAWEGLGEFFRVGEEILVASSTDGAMGALDLSDAELRCVAARSRERVLAQHTADHRAAELEQLLARAPAPAAAGDMRGGGR